MCGLYAVDYYTSVRVIVRCRHRVLDSPVPVSTCHMYIYIYIYSYICTLNATSVQYLPPLPLEIRLSLPFLRHPFIFSLPSYSIIQMDVTSDLTNTSNPGEHLLIRFFFPKCHSAAAHPLKPRYINTNRYRSEINFSGIDFPKLLLLGGVNLNLSEKSVKLIVYIYIYIPGGGRDRRSSVSSLSTSSN